MKLTWLPIFLAILTWPVLTGPVLAGGDSPSTNPTVYESVRTVRIESGSQFGDDIEQAHQRFLKEMQDCLVEGDWSADSPTIVFTVSSPSTGDGSEVARAADSRIDSFRQFVMDSVATSRLNWKHELNALEQQLQELQAKRDALEKRVSEASGDLMVIQKDAGLSDDDTESPHELIHTLETQYEAAQIDLAGKAARQQALAEAIAKLSAQAEANVSADPVAQQLQAVADVKEKELDREKKLVLTGGIANGDVDRTAAELAQAKAAVLERREAAAKAAGADSLEQWNHDLMLLSVDVTELKARVEVMKKRLDELSRAVPVLERAISAKAMSKNLDEIDTEILTLQVRIDHLKRNLNPADEPKVNVLESKNGPVKPEPVSGQ
jgi:chromosome segregation ATPase